MFQKSLATVLLVGGLVFAGHGWYVGGKSTPIPKPSPASPTVIKIISDLDDPFPQTPLSPAVLAASTPIRTVLKGNPEDAIKLARTFRAWSDLIHRDTTLKTMGQFRAAYVRSVQVLAQKSKLAGKYKGKIDAAIDATMNAAFNAPSGVQDTVPFTDVSRASAVVALDAVSYQCYQAFIDSSGK